MSRMNDMTHKIQNENWIVSTSVDEDGHLTVWIDHTDGTEVHAIGIDTYAEEWRERFTTDKIERDWNESNE